MQSGYRAVPALFFAAALAIVAVTCAAEEAPLFPVPAELEPDVRFWTRVYTEIDQDHGFVHDNRHLQIVYETLKLPRTLGRKASARHRKKAAERYKRILLKLASGNRKDLGTEERRVLELWPDDVSSGTLKAAADQIRFQRGQSDRFRAGLVRSGAWRSYIEATLSDLDLPTGLAVLPHVESSFNPRARSHAGAAGMWQFTRSTGRRYQRVDDVLDERLDPYTSTVAAARLLRRNHGVTGTWPLALTAYNHGAAGMRRATRKLGTRDIATIARKYESRTFGFASRNFYVSFLAARHVDANAERYFGALQLDPPAELHTVSVPRYLNADAAARALGVDAGTLRRHNPALRPVVWSGKKHIPKGYALRVPDDLAGGEREAELVRVASIEGADAQKADRYYKVRRGDTLAIIASRYNVGVGELARANKIRNRNRIRVGQRLKIPGAGGGPAPVAAAPKTYKIKRGDSLSVIARRFGLDVRVLMAQNDISDQHRIRAGQTLRVTADN